MAKRFSFRLAPLLKIREAKKKDAQRLLGKRMGELRLLQDRLQGLKEAQSDAFGRRRVQPGRPVDMDLWRSIERFLASVERRIEETNAEMAKAQALVDEARQALTKAHREHLTLERLRDRRKEQYDMEAAKEEQRQADELALLRYQFKPSMAPHPGPARPHRALAAPHRQRPRPSPDPLAARSGRSESAPNFGPGGAGMQPTECNLALTPSCAK